MSSRPDPAGSAIPATVCRMPRLSWSSRGGRREARTLAEETAIALVYDGKTEAVMMATPTDLADFALGFSLTEGFISDLSEIVELDIAPRPDGVEVRLWLAPAARYSLDGRRRRLAGPVGCGLCGLESLAEAVKPCRTVTGNIEIGAAIVARAVAALAQAQTLHAATHAAHAAGFFDLEGRLIAIREDVGRHNALDKLAGALARNSPNSDPGLVVITSRVSIDMVQKAAVIGAPVLIAASAPTALATRAADAAGMTLIALARGDDFEVFTHPVRVRESRSIEDTALDSMASAL